MDRGVGDLDWRVEFGKEILNWGKALGGAVWEKRKV